MGLDLAATALAPWVRHYVAASNALSGIHRAATPGEVAAHRGFFARRRVDARNVLLLHAHLADTREGSACDGAGRDGLASGIGTLLCADLTPWQLYVAFAEMAPFRAGNRRCARALWMSRRLGEGYRPEADRRPAEWAATFLAEGPRGGRADGAGIPLA